jgi:hypothetical protein
VCTTPLLLAGLRLSAPAIRRLPLVPEAATGSFAGGLAVSYVFLHLLPELAEGNGLITYTMVLRLRTGIAFALLFTVAMGLHFVRTDR